MEQTIEIIDRAEFKDGKGIVEYSQTAAALAALNAKYAGKVYDLTTTKGDAEARAARLELTTLRTSLEKKRKEFKAPALEFGKMIDAEAARITGQITALETPIDIQIKADEKRRADEKAEKERLAAERAAGYRAKIESVRGFVAKCAGITSERIAKGIAQVELLNVSEDAFAEFSGEAVTAKAETLLAMQTIFADTKAREVEVERLEQQRIENERQAADLARQREEIEAREKVIREAEQSAAAAETLRIEREADEARRRQADAEALRVKIEAQERAKAEAAAAETLRREREADEARIAAEKRAAQTANAPQPDPAHENLALRPPHRQETVASAHANAQASQIATAPTSVDTGALMNLGTINARLDGVTVNAEFLERLGFLPSTTLKNSNLYREADFQRICTEIMRHIQTVASTPLKAAA